MSLTFTFHSIGYAFPKRRREAGAIFRQGSASIMAIGSLSNCSPGSWVGEVPAQYMMACSEGAHPGFRVALPEYVNIGLVELVSVTLPYDRE